MKIFGKKYELIQGNLSYILTSKLMFYGRGLSATIVSLS